MKIKNDLKKFLYELLTIDSLSGNEYLAVKFLNEMFSELGFNGSMQYVSKSSFNLVINDIKNPDILIATHVDTVPIVCEPRIIGDEVYGTGAVDAKGSIAAIYYALSKLRDLRDNVSIAIFSQEETSGGGAISYLSNHKPRLVLVLEPTNLELSNAAYGYLELLLETFSSTYHPDLIPISDIEKTSTEKALFILNVVRDFCAKQNITFTITNMDAKGNSFFVPDNCKISINFHIPPGTKSLTLLNELRIFLRERVLNNDFSIKIIDYANPFKTNLSIESDELAKIYKKIFNRDPKWKVFRSWCDATTFNENGVPSFIFGPGDPALAHSKREKINVNEILYAGKFLRAILEY